MFILKIKNNVGPGNQMFMYARAYSLAKKYNKKIIIVSEISNKSVRQNILHLMAIDKSIVKGYYKIDFIKSDIVYRIVRKIIFDYFLKLPFFHQIINDASKSRLKEEIKINKRKIYVLDGYFECHEYFDKYREELINQYKPNYVLDKKTSKIIRDVENCESVAVHVRKGDFKEFGRLMKDDYYNEKMENIKKIVEKPVFVILSEDIEVRKQYKNRSDVIILNLDTPHKYIDEWYILTKCRYHIIANSTYSWWSSYISNYHKKVVLKPDINEYLYAEKDNTVEMYENYYI